MEDKANLIKQYLMRDTILISKLRKFGKSKYGLVNEPIRAAVWPLLLGLSPPDMADKKIIGASTTTYLLDSKAQYVLSGIKEYDDTIDKDSNRSLFNMEMYSQLPEDKLKAAQNELGDMMKTFYLQHKDQSYVQGINDIFALCMKTMGQSIGYACSEKIIYKFFQEISSKQLNLMVILEFIYYIISIVDVEVANRIGQHEYLAFAINWIVTWFIHTEKNDALSQRIYDYILSNHPTGILYLCAAVIISQKQEIMTIEGGDHRPDLVHQMFQNYQFKNQEQFENCTLMAHQIKLKCPKADLIAFIRSKIPATFPLTQNDTLHSYLRKECSLHL